MASDATATPKTEAERKRFENPPILEAIISITVPSLSESVLIDFVAAADALASLGYQKEAPVSTHEFMMTIIDGASSANNRDATVGYRFQDNQAKFSFQFLRTGLVFSQLGHYESWEVFTTEARKIWALYLETVGPVQPLVFTVRYINRILIPRGRQIEDFVRLFILVPHDLPQLITQHALRVSMPILDPPGQLNHQQYLLAPVDDQHYGMMLDNEFTFSAFDTQLSSLWDRIDAVRDVKDDYFFKMLTPEALRTFDA